MPLQLVLIPMLFMLPPSAVPLCVAVALALGFAPAPLPRKSRDRDDTAKLERLYASLGGLWRQRLRWSEGGTQTVLRLTPQMFDRRLWRLWLVWCNYMLSVLWVATHYSRGAAVLKRCAMSWRIVGAWMKNPSLSCFGVTRGGRMP